MISWKSQFWRITLLFAAALWFCAARVYAQALTVDQYDHRLAVVQQDITHESSNGKQIAFQALQPILRCTVKTADGEIVFVDNRPLLKQMRSAQESADETARAKQWSQLNDEITLIRGELPQANVSPDTKALDSARSVLLSKEFASEPLPGKSVWDKMAEAIRNWLKKLHIKPGPMPSGNINPIVPVALLITVVVIAVGLIAYLIAIWARGRHVGAEKSIIDSGLALTFQEKEFVASHNYSGLYALADEAAKRQDFRSAFRLMFVATLVYLDAEGAIKLDRSKTNWEYLKAIAANADLNRQLRPFVQDFDRIWYGLNSASEDDFHRAIEWYQAIQEVSKQAGATPEQTAQLASGKSAGAS